MHSTTFRLHNAGSYILIMTHHGGDMFAASTFQLLSAAVIIFGTVALHAEWDTPDNGNPLLPGYTADPSIMYDSASATFYIYSTTDGVWISYSADPQVAYSTDFIHWKFRPLVLPSFWPKRQLWAPSAMRHPANGRYYLMYCIGNAAYIAYSSTPYGPWTNAVSGQSPLYSSGELTGAKDWIDPQFFIDEETVYFTFGQQGDMGIARLSFDPQTFLATVDGTDPRMSDGVKYRCKRLAGLSNNLEGSCMFKRGDNYYITYSNSACQNYNVRYARASSPVGPFTASNNIIVQRNNSDGILGPGHNSILRYGNDYYICYHRQHYQYIDVKRQTCIDRLIFDGDDLHPGVQSNTGVHSGSGALESLVAGHRAVDDGELAFGKKVVASGESDYKGGKSGNISENFASISRFYKGRYAVDRNNATRWAPDKLPGYLIVDLGRDYKIGRCETTFELVMRTYRYRIEYLFSSDAKDLAAAETSDKWQLFADRSKNSDNVSPVVDSSNVTARFMKITLLSADLPVSNSEISTILQTDYADRVSIFEFKVFGSEIVKVGDAAVFENRFNAARWMYPLSLSYYSLSGRLCKTVSVSNTVHGSFDAMINRLTNDLPAGVYIVRLHDSGMFHSEITCCVK